MRYGPTHGAPARDAFADTRITRGRVHALRPGGLKRVPGGWINLSHVRIAETLSYAQQCEASLIQATLLRTDLVTPRGGAKRDRCGAISFTPGGQDRVATAHPGEIVGIEIGLEPWFIEDACEQRTPGSWAAAFNVSDAKAFSVARMLAETFESEGGLAEQTLVVALARHLGRRYAGAVRRRDDAWLHPAALRRIVDCLEEEPERAISLARMAGMSGLGVSAFVRAFRGSVGTTPAAFAQARRADKAARILREKDLPLAEVAAMAGFASASHLVRVFRSRYGSPPARWRRDAVNFKISA